jgi:NAD(P)-dependent dehydrogenase (short-subunit alcohol dehydrogenase family)
MRFEGKTVVVTGAGAGIGAGCAERFAAEGAYVVVTNRTIAKAQAVAEGIVQAGGRAIARGLDVALTEEWSALRDELHGSGRLVDVVVNNAYALEKLPAHELSEASWSRQIDVDLSAVYHSVRAFLPDLAEVGGTLVNVASVHALVSWKNHPAYAAAKGGMLALTRQLAVQYGPRVRVNAVIPGPVLTAAWDGADDEGLAQAAAGTALGRLGTAEEVAAAVAFLASSEASFITGAQLVVDGGQTISAEGK